MFAVQTSALSCQTVTADITTEISVERTGYLFLLHDSTVPMLPRLERRTRTTTFEMFLPELPVLPLVIPRFEQRNHLL